MRNNFNLQASSGSAWKTIERNFHLIGAVSVPAIFLAASVLGSGMAPKNENLPSWVDDFDARPEGLVCKITDLKTGRSFTAEDGEKIEMPRGFSVASSPSSCNVTSPDKEMCQLRGGPIAPIC